MLIYSAIQIEQIHDAITATELITALPLNFDPWPSNPLQFWVHCLLLFRGTPIPHRSALCNRNRCNRTPFYYREIVPWVRLEHLQAHRRFSSNAPAFSSLSNFRCSSQIRLLFLYWFFFSNTYSQFLVTKFNLWSSSLVQRMPNLESQSQPFPSQSLFSSSALGPFDMKWLQVW
jgi:hypothetical protein